MNVRCAPSWVWCLFVLLTVLGDGSAQQGQPGSAPAAPGNQGTTFPVSPFGGPSSGQPNARSGAQLPQGPTGQQAYRDYLDPVWVQPRPVPPFTGFPIFPSRLSGYGSYPGTKVEGRPDLFGPALLSPALPESPDWPAWVRMRSRAPLPYAPDVALLIRHAERVWWRAADEPVFVPLFYHDKFCTLTVGAEVEVRHRGQLELLLHDSSRVLAQGPTRIELLALTADEVEVSVTTLTRLSLAMNGRRHRIRLPDGSELRWSPAAAATAADAVAAAVVLDRIDDPGWLGGRATIRNLGETNVTWQHATGTVEVPPAHRVTLFLSRSPSPTTAGLSVDGVTIERRGAEAIARSQAGGNVRWCGASFQVPAGVSMTLQPLQGNPFGSAEATVSAAGRD